MSFTPDVPTTEEALAAIFASPLSPLPPSEQRLGSTRVSWLEQAPGEVFIHAEGGTVDDRHYASTLVALQLASHGYRRAQFDMDTGAWTYLPSKANGVMSDEDMHPLQDG